MRMMINGAKYDNILHQIGMFKLKHRYIQIRGNYISICMLYRPQDKSTTKIKKYLVISIG